MAFGFSNNCLIQLEDGPEPVGPATQSDFIVGPFEIKFEEMEALAYEAFRHRNTDASFRSKTLKLDMDHLYVGYSVCGHPNWKVVAVVVDSAEVPHLTPVFGPKGDQLEVTRPAMGVIVEMPMQQMQQRPQIH